jgi:hypothetical protein
MQPRRQKILHRMIASILRHQSALNLLMNGILIFWGCSKIFELFHPFKRFIILHVVIVSCILISRHDHVLSFLSMYF